MAKGNNQLYKVYSEFYDLVYKDNNNHAKESRDIDDLFKKISHQKPKDLLDIGCGTGKHAIEFARLGYKVTGVDASPHMLARAKDNVKKSGFNIKLENGSLPELKLKNKFDVAIALFDVINYLKNTDDLKLAFKNIGKILRPGGILFFIIWNPQTARKLYKPFVYKLFSDEYRHLLKISETKIVHTGNIDLKFNYFVFDKKGGFRNLQEDYHMHLFSLEDIKNSLKGAGFELISVGESFELGKHLPKNSFRASIIALRK